MTLWRCVILGPLFTLIGTGCSGLSGIASEATDTGTSTATESLFVAAPSDNDTRGAYELYRVAMLDGAEAWNKARQE